MFQGVRAPRAPDFFLYISETFRSGLRNAPWALVCPLVILENISKNREQSLLFLRTQLDSVETWAIGPRGSWCLAVVYRDRQSTYYGVHTMEYDESRGTRTGGSSSQDRLIGGLRCHSWHGTVRKGDRRREAMSWWGEKKMMSVPARGRQPNRDGGANAANRPEPRLGAASRPKRTWCRGI